MFFWRLVVAATAMFLTPCITQIVLRFNETELGQATGFFLQMDGNWFIVTNWHVLSGRRPDTGQPRHIGGATPNSCTFFLSELNEAGMAWREINRPLVDANTGEATWLQHPTQGQQIDVAALPVGAEHVGRSKNLLGDGGHDADMLIDLGGEVFLPGYPLGLTGGGMFPIWKRASLASALEWGPGVDTKFYVDTASREGMSGSPCLAVSNWKHYRLDRATGKVSVIRRPLSWRLLGVYSGRLNAADDLGAQIGIVWREQRVREVIQGGTTGTFQIG